MGLSFGQPNVRAAALVVAGWLGSRVLPGPFKILSGVVAIGAVFVLARGVFGSGDPPTVDDQSNAPLPPDLVIVAQIQTPKFYDFVKIPKGGPETYAMRVTYRNHSPSPWLVFPILNHEVDAGDLPGGSTALPPVELAGNGSAVVDYNVPLGLPMGVFTKPHHVSVTLFTEGQGGSVFQHSINFTAELD